MSVLGGTGGEDKEERRENTHAEMKIWGRVVALVRAAFGEGLLAE